MTPLRAALIACLLTVVAPAAPASAHSGGRAQLYVHAVHLEPRPGGWRAELVVRDADSGRPEPGVGVELTATGGAGQTAAPVALTDPDGQGRYAGDVSLTEGLWTVTVRADDIPGGPRALPFSRSWSATLEAGRAIDLGGSSPRPAEGGGRGHVPAGPLALTVLAAVALLLVRRVRPLSPAGRPR